VSLVRRDSSASASAELLKVAAAAAAAAAATTLAAVSHHADADPLVLLGLPVGALLGRAMEEAQQQLLRRGVQWVVCFGLCVFVVERSFTPLCLVSLSGVTLRCVSCT
jgi:hypothetical protein